MTVSIMDTLPNERTRARVAAAATVLLVIASATLVVVATDRPFVGGFATEERAGRAAIVVRDHVMPFQMWASEAFARSQLEPAYAELDYINFTGDAMSRSMHGLLVALLFDGRAPARRYRQHLEESEDYATFHAALDRALEAHERVDLFVFAHTNDYVSWLDELADEKLERLGLVYNAGCHNGKQGQDWLASGADTYIGHPGVSMSPLFAAGFLRRWARGVPVDAATRSANAEMREFLDITAPFCTYVAGAIYARSAATIGGNRGLSIR